MSRSGVGYADFFPAAPSVLAKKKAQADQEARREKERQQRKPPQTSAAPGDDYARDTSSCARPAPTSTSSASSTNPVAGHVQTQNLTPTTSNSSPPVQLSPANGTKSEIPVRTSLPTTNGHRESREAPPPIPTPKATPPAAVAPAQNNNRNVKNYRIVHDPAIAKGGENKKPVYRFNGEGCSIPVADPRFAIDCYVKGAPAGKKKLLPELLRTRWQWDSNYIGPGPPSQIVITGLSPLTTEGDVQANFRQFGEIAKCEVQRDPATSGSLGICSIQFRDSKITKTVAHNSAKKAVGEGNSMKIAMHQIRVQLDRDGITCAKLVKYELDKKRKAEEEEMRRMEEAKRRARPPPAVRVADDGPPQRRDQRSIQDLDARFSKPRPQEYKAFDDLGNRPSVFIASRYIPAERRYIKHLIGRLRNYGISTVLVDKTGFYVVFLDLRGMEKCYSICNGEPLFDYPMKMKPYPRGNRTGLPRGRSRSPLRGLKPTLGQQSPVQRSPDYRKRKSCDIVKESSTQLILDLRTAVRNEVRKRLADVEIFDLLDPQRLRKRRRPENDRTSSTPFTPALRPELSVDTSMQDASTPITDRSAATPMHVPRDLADTGLPGKRPSAWTLPKFKKRAPKRQHTPASDGVYTNGTRTFKEAARPLAHRLNQNYGDSDDESMDRPVSRGFSTDLADDDARSITPSMVDGKTLKRKRTGTRLATELKDVSVGSEDEDMGEPEVLEEGKSMEVKQEPADAKKDLEVLNDFICDDSESEDDVAVGRRSHKRPRALEFTDSEDEDDVPIANKRKARIETERERQLREEENTVVDVVDDEVDDMSTPAVVDEVTASPRKGKLVKGKPASEPEVPDATPEPEEEVAPATPVDYTWTLSTPGAPQVTVEDDSEVILDLDGFQNLVKDEEDFRFLQMALAEQEREKMGNVHAWAYKTKEAKAANMGGRKGVPIKSYPKIEGFYRENPSGSSRTEGYRKIPEAEKSQYLPHRLAVAAKRAIMAETSPTQTKTAAPTLSTAAKPVSSSRSNRVNNRRFVAELNNQKQILSGDADVIRFNQLKKRRKPVRFARSRIHNWGLYAMEQISANDMIIEYVGEIVRQQVADMRERKYLKSGIGSSYLFRIDENTVIDATKRGGIARFINHSCTPNCTAKIIKVEGSKRIVIYALRDIAENEELTYDYKFEREIDSDDRIPCLCGSSGCKGFLN